MASLSLLCFLDYVWVREVTMVVVMAVALVIAVAVVVVLAVTMRVRGVPQLLC